MYAGDSAEFRRRLQALFDVSLRETGDVYLMQEVLARSGRPNRGNKAHLTYFPVIADYLGWLAETAGEDSERFLPDLNVLSESV
jgi:hypothetical protein